MESSLEAACCSNNSFICCLLRGLGNVFEKLDRRVGTGPPYEALVVPRSPDRGCEIPLLNPCFVPKSYAVNGNNGPIGVVVDEVVGKTNDGGCEVVVVLAPPVTGNGPELYGAILLDDKVDVGKGL